MALNITISETGGRELTKKEVAIIKVSLQSCIDINTATADGKTLAISVSAFALLNIEYITCISIDLCPTSEVVTVTFYRVLDETFCLVDLVGV